MGKILQTDTPEAVCSLRRKRGHVGTLQCSCLKPVFSPDVKPVSLAITVAPGHCPMLALATAQISIMSLTLQHWEMLNRYYT